VTTSEPRGGAVLSMTMSLDGFVNDREGSVARLYPDLEGLAESEAFRSFLARIGAVVMGRHAYDMGNGDFTGYELQMPIFVVTSRPPATPAKGENEHLTFTFVTEGVASAIDRAKAAAGGKDVVVIGGADVARQCLRRRLVDEVQIAIAPVLLGNGLRLFEELDDEPIALTLIEVIESPIGTEIRYRLTGKDIADRQGSRSIPTDARPSIHSRRARHASGRSMAPVSRAGGRPARRRAGAR